MFLARQAARNPSEHPAESERIDDLATDEGGVVTVAVTGCDLARQLRDRLVEDDDVVGDGVRPGVARTEHSREALTSPVGEDEERVEAPSTLVGRTGSGFVVGVDRDERGVDVEGDRVGSARRCRSAPHLGADVGDRAFQRFARLGGDLVEGPPHRRVRRNESEERGLSRAGTRCRHSSPHHRRSPPSAGRAPCRGRAAGPVRTVSGSPTRARHRDPNDRQKHKAHAVRRGPRHRSHRVPRSPERAGSFHLGSGPSCWGSGDFAILRIPGKKGTYVDTRLSGQAAA